MYISRQDMDLTLMLRQPSHAAALIRGSSQYPKISGKVRFYQAERGVIVITEVLGLPKSSDGCHNPVFGFHIHSGERCSGNSNDPFADSMMHYNPDNRIHPCHAGDLPPLFGNDGYAFSAVFTNRFCIEEIIGKTIIIHSQPDDFTTQPSGNSGAKIACGEIVSMGI